MASKNHNDSAPICDYDGIATPQLAATSVTYLSTSCQIIQPQLLFFIDTPGLGTMATMNTVLGMHNERMQLKKY